MAEEDTRERHPIRSLLRLVVIAGVVLSAGRFVARKKEEYAGLTESQARDKLIVKMTPKVGDDTAREIADRVIPKLRQRRLIKSDPIDGAADGVEKAANEEVTEAADEVSEAVDSVVNDSAKD